MGRVFMAVLWRDLRVVCSRWGDIASPLVFFILIGSLPEETVKRIADSVK